MSHVRSKDGTLIAFDRVGEEGPAVEAAGALAAVLPNAEYHVLDGQSHNVSMPALAPVLKTFFANGLAAGSGTTRGA